MSLRRRVAWAVIGGQLTHYSASAQVVVDGGRTRVVWIADFLPDGAVGQIDQMMAQGMAVMKVTLDSICGGAISPTAPL